MLEIKNTVTEMKSAFDGLHNRLDMAKKRTIAFEDRSKCTECLCVPGTVLGSDEQDKWPCPFGGTLLQAEDSEYIHSSQGCCILSIFAICYHPHPGLCLFEISQMTYIFTSCLLTFQSFPSPINSWPYCQENQSQL